MSAEPQKEFEIDFSFVSMFPKMQGSPLWFRYHVVWVDKNSQEISNMCLILKKYNGVSKSLKTNVI